MLQWVSGSPAKLVIRYLCILYRLTVDRSSCAQYSAYSVYTYWLHDSLLSILQNKSRPIIWYSCNYFISPAFWFISKQHIFFIFDWKSLFSYWNMYFFFLTEKVYFIFGLTICQTENLSNWKLVGLRGGAQINIQ